MTLETFIGVIIVKLRKGAKPEDYNRLLKLLSWRNRARTRAYLDEFRVWGNAIIEVDLPEGP